MLSEYEELCVLNVWNVKVDLKTSSLILLCHTDSNVRTRAPEQEVSTCWLHMAPVSRAAAERPAELAVTTGCIATLAVSYRLKVLILFFLTLKHGVTFGVAVVMNPSFNHDLPHLSTNLGLASPTDPETSCLTPPPQPMSTSSSQLTGPGSEMCPLIRYNFISSNPWSL